MQGQRLCGLPLEARRTCIRWIVVEPALAPVLDVSLGVELGDLTRQLLALSDQPLAEVPQSGR